MGKGTRIAVIVLVALAVAGVLVAKGFRAPGETGRVMEGIPTLLELGSTECIPCKKMAPILAELSEEYAGVFAVRFIDVYADERAAQAYNVSIIPTQIFLDADGNELFRHTGFLPKEDILTKWRELGVLAVPRDGPPEASDG